MEYSLGWTTNWLTEGTLDGKGIPDEIRRPLLEMNADIHDLEAVYKTPDRGRIQVQRAKQLGIYDWIIEHSPRLWGTPDDICERPERTRRPGARQLGVLAAEPRYLRRRRRCREARADREPRRGRQAGGVRVPRDRRRRGDPGAGTGYWEVPRASVWEPAISSLRIAAGPST